jgi:DNA-binding NtrC family response regulator
MQTLLAYDWPGNVRELETMCERIAESCTCGQVRLGCLGASVLFPPEETEAPADGASASPRTTIDSAGTPSASPLTTSDSPRTTSAGAQDDDRQLPDLPLDEHLRQVEAQRIAAALTKTGGNKSRAAELLGIKRSTLGDRIVRCGLQHASSVYNLSRCPLPRLSPRS